MVDLLPLILEDNLIVLKRGNGAKERVFSVTGMRLDHRLEPGYFGCVVDVILRVIRIMLPGLPGKIKAIP